MSKAEKTKAFIIEKTAALFNEKGYAGTSLNDMTEATGLTKGSIYGNFANKDEVALAVFDHNLQKINRIVKENIDTSATYKEQLLAYTDIYYNFSKYSLTPGGCPILNTAVESDDTHPALRQKATEAILNWKSNIKKLVTKGIAAKEFDSSVDAEQFAITFIAAIEGGIMLSSLLNKPDHLKTVVKSVKKMIEELS
ncbi:MAG: TetR/AcrR family transcriptional regulator [Filimonas sp.]|nr:TetR/AcrR family transcriptional regulator [Filimonas sp.]